MSTIHAVESVVLYVLRQVEQLRVLCLRHRLSLMGTALQRLVLSGPSRPDLLPLLRFTSTSPNNDSGAHPVIADGRHLCAGLGSTWGSTWAGTWGSVHGSPDRCNVEPAGLIGLGSGATVARMGDRRLAYPM